MDTGSARCRSAGRGAVTAWLACALAAGCTAAAGELDERSPSASSDTVALGVLPVEAPRAEATAALATSTTAAVASAGPSTATTPAGPATTTAAPPVRLVFTGDVLVHSPLWREALADGGDTHDFAPMFADLRPVVESADLAVCHLETPIAPPFEAYSSSPRYGVPAEIVDSLADVGFDHCSTASNHTFDRGVAGVVATIDRFEQVGMTQHGMAADPAAIEPVLLEVGSIVVGHVSATYGYDEGAPPPGEPWRSNLIDVGRLIADARLARDRGADVVVVSLHWGDSMSRRASAGQRAIAGELAMSGVVDLVVGHHAHVVQPIEQLGRMWVAYGLGNVLSNMPLGSGDFSSPATGDGVVLEVVVAGSSITSVVARPVWVDHEAGWVVRDVATALADPALTSTIGPQLEASWRRTVEVVGAYVPTG